MRRFHRPTLTSAASALIVAAVFAQPKFADQWLAKPVDERTFKTFLDFFTYDRRLPFELRTIDVEEREGIKKEHLSFQSTPGVQVFGFLWQPMSGGPQKTPAAILLHGGVARGKDNPSNRLHAELLVKAGWKVLAIDLQYFGERNTGLLTTFTEQDKHERLYNQPSVYLAWVIQTVKDVGRSFDLLIERGADPGRIALVGISRGAIVGTIAGAADRRLRATVLLYGAHFDALEREHLAAACPANYVGRISPRPLLAINGLYDADHVKATSVEPLLRLARPPKEIIWEEAGHQSSLTEEHRAAMLQWLRDNVK